MNALRATTRRFLGNNKAATMAEYAILVAVIAIVVIVAARALGNSVAGKLNSAATSLS